MNKNTYWIKNNRVFVKSENNGVTEIPAQYLYDMWQNPRDGNKPVEYKNGSERSEKLVSLFNKFCSKEDSVFEIGCNIGRNLDFLYRAGYKNLSGLDINNEALEAGKQLYPDTVGKIPLIWSPIEEQIMRIPNSSIDVVFTMGVLMHLHPSSTWVFNYIRHIVKKYLIVAEQEDGFCEYVFPRNYKTIFEDLNLKQVFEEFIEYPNDVDDLGTIKVTYRVFEK